ncbi:MAG: YitT family protein [Bacteroidaceae bacterium]|nr:YitT family protein [Bacteroidales bacterium]MEA4966763.1 YitT family protein [Bacteroidaceae bacterium]MEA5100692.1 YitT family protein [Bacteroidales bacterium]
MQNINPINSIRKTSTGKIIWQYFMIILGVLMYTFAWSVFLIPQNIVGGGVAGISSIIFLGTGIPVGISNFAINIVLLLIGIKTLGSKFGINTIFGIIVASLSFILWQQVVHIEQIIDATQFEPFMCAIIGAGISGVGIGTTFNYGGNSGGTDIIALIITKYKNISAGTVILYIDIFIIASAFILPEMSITNVVYGYTVMFVFTYVLDLTIEGNKQSYQIMVFSSKADEIADAIGSGVKRGVTIIDAHGWYTKNEQKIVLVIARKQDKVEIMRIIKLLDPAAFISVDKVQGVFGKNFDTLRN